MTKFNGHKNWNHWNVSLWINNDEGLYRLAQRYAHHHRRTVAASLMLADLQDMGQDKTPDGAPYSLSSVRSAMAGM